LIEGLKKVTFNISRRQMSAAYIYIGAIILSFYTGASLANIIRNIAETASCRAIGSRHGIYKVYNPYYPYSRPAYSSICHSSS
jgi:hypothetical protein